MEVVEEYLQKAGFTKIHRLDSLKVTAKVKNDKRYFLAEGCFGLHISEAGFNERMWLQLVEAIGRDTIKQLSVLYLARNEFNDFEINDFPKLSFLNIAQNGRLMRLHIQNAPQLKDIYAARCVSLSSFTMSGRFEQLEKLEIYWGRLYKLQLPPLPRLRYLHFALNQISDLSPIATHLLTPELLFFWGENPLSENISNALKNDKKGFLEYLRSIQKPEEIRQLNECKVIFVGLGSSGKTSLMRRLFNDSYHKGEPETHGINKLNKKIGDIQVNFWDFGGQYIQHSLHQFFFTEKTLYVLVLDRRKGEKPEYWLEQIESLGKDSPIMVVFNKVDTVQDYKEEKTKEIQDKYRNIVGFYYLSCETQYRFDTFIKDFHHTIQHLPFIKEPYNQEFFELKKALESETKDYISYDTYEHIFNQKNFSSISNKEFWLKTLHQIGVISYFPQVPDYQILNPEWLTVGIYHLFLHPTCTTTKKGRIILSDLGRIFEQPVTNSITKKAFEYQSRHYRYLLNLMREFQLCAENPHKKNEWLIPTGFAVNPKISFDDFRQQPLAGSKAQLYAFKYDTWIPSTILRTIAATIQWADNEDYWQNGILLKHIESQTQALVQGDEKEEMIKIWIKGERIRDFWLVLDTVISSISNFFEGNKYKKLVFLDEENKQFISYQALFHALIDKEFDLYLSEFRKRINVLDYLGMFQEQKMIEEELKKYRQKMENEKGRDTIIIEGTINGGNITIGGGNNKLGKSATPSPEPKKEEKPENRHAEDKAIKKWKMASIWWALGATAITAVLIYLYQSEFDFVMTKEEWLEFKKSSNDALVKFIISGIWGSFILRMLYDRFSDSSKEKAKRDLEKQKQKG